MYYKLYLRHKESRHKDKVVKHCIRLGDVYFRPDKLRDGSPEHEPVDNPHDVGWEYVPVELDSTGFYILKVESEGDAWEDDE